MFNFSLAELIVMVLIGLIFIKPQDLPEIAHFLGRMFVKAKNIFNNLRAQFKEVENELGINDLKDEINRGIAEEKIKSQKTTKTVIVDIYGNEHHIDNISQVRPDLSKDEIEEEVIKLNSQNQNDQNRN